MTPTRADRPLLDLADAAFEPHPRQAPRVRFLARPAARLDHRDGQ